MTNKKRLNEIQVWCQSQRERDLAFNLSVSTTVLDIEFLLAQLKKRDRALQLVRAINPLPDLSHHKYVTAWKLMEETAKKAIDEE